MKLVSGQRELVTFAICEATAHVDHDQVRKMRSCRVCARGASRQNRSLSWMRAAYHGSRRFFLCCQSPRNPCMSTLCQSAASDPATCRQDGACNKCRTLLSISADPLRVIAVGESPLPTAGVKPVQAAPTRPAAPRAPAAGVAATNQPSRSPPTPTATPQASSATQATAPPPPPPPPPKRKPTATPLSPSVTPAVAMPVEPVTSPQASPPTAAAAPATARRALRGRPLRQRPIRTSIGC